jgi:hypothetical protein
MTGYLQHNSRMPAAVSSFLFFLSGTICILFNNHATGDYGNYYYASRMLAEGKFDPRIYGDLHLFNDLAHDLGAKDFFGNYNPVPPFSLLFYIPFSFFSIAISKITFCFFGLTSFCFTWYRLNRSFRSNLFSFLIPVVFFETMRQNLLQGQTYLLICALLMETFTQYKSGGKKLASLFLSVAISLKIIPILFLVFFLIKRDYRICLLSLLFCILFFFIPGFFTGMEVPYRYVVEFIPRLFENDVVGKYYAGNQSVHTLLNNLFSKDLLQNPNPVTELPLFIPISLALFEALILLLLAYLAKRKTDEGYFFCFLAIVILARYNASYVIILLAPFVHRLCVDHLRGWKGAATLLILATTAIPIIYSDQSIFLFKFARLTVLLLIFVTTVLVYRFMPSFKYYLGLSFALFSFSLCHSGVPDGKYFSLQNRNGILYGIEPFREGLLLKWTEGSGIQQTDTLRLSPSPIAVRQLKINNSQIVYEKKVLTSSKDLKKDPLLYKDSILYLSDGDQGLGFYKIRILPLK